MTTTTLDTTTLDTTTLRTSDIAGQAAKLAEYLSTGADRAIALTRTGGATEPGSPYRKNLAASVAASFNEHYADHGQAIHTWTAEAGWHTRATRWA